MTNIRRAVFASFVLTTMSVVPKHLIAQAAFIRVTEIQARQAAGVAAAAAKSDENVFIAKFDEEIKKINPEYEARRYIVESSNALSIVVVAPVGQLRVSAADAIRRFEPLEKL